MTDSTSGISVIIAEDKEYDMKPNIESQIPSTINAIPFPWHIPTRYVIIWTQECILYRKTRLIERWCNASLIWTIIMCLPLRRLLSFYFEINSIRVTTLSLNGGTSLAFLTFVNSFCTFIKQQSTRFGWPITYVALIKKIFVLE